MRKQGQTKLVEAKTFDYRTQKGINGLTAYYLKDSDEIPCCVPTVLAFETREEAEEFQTDHSGTVFTFEEALNLPIEELMKPEKLKMMREKGIL
jgi:hypothetical protein